MPIVHIVDDDSSFRTAASRLLRAAGYDVAVYESVQHAGGNRARIRVRPPPPNSAHYG